MKFLLTYAQDPSRPPPSAEHMKAIGEFTQRNMAAGIVVMTGGLVRPTRGVHVTCKAGKASVVDGPFAETKELIDGFALVEVESKERAIAVAKEFMELAGDGEGEVLQIFDGGGPPPKS